MVLSHIFLCADEESAFWLLCHVAEELCAFSLPFTDPRAAKSTGVTATSKPVGKLKLSAKPVPIAAVTGETVCYHAKNKRGLRIDQVLCPAFVCWFGGLKGVCALE